MQNSFSYESFKLRLVLKQRYKRPRKWPTVAIEYKIIIELFSCSKLQKRKYFKIVQHMRVATLTRYMSRKTETQGRFTFEWMLVYVHQPCME